MTAHVGGAIAPAPMPGSILKAVLGPRRLRCIGPPTPEDFPPHGGEGPRPQARRFPQQVVIPRNESGVSVEILRGPQRTL